MPTILVVDDDKLLLEWLDGELSDRGHQVFTAAHGGDALAIARTSRPHLVILDGSLPGLDGFQILERLRADRPNLPVIMLTGRSAKHDVMQGLKLGLRDYVVKPVDIHALVSRIDRVFVSARPPIAFVDDLRPDAGGVNGQRPG